jgi:hypothetical protein
MYKVHPFGAIDARDVRIIIVASPSSLSVSCEFLPFIEDLGSHPDRL